MDICLRLVYLIAVLHVLAFSTILCKNDEEWTLSDDENDLPISNLIQSTVGFLAGEETPVWQASYSFTNGDIALIKFSNGIIKDAIDYWKRKKVRRSVDESGDNVIENLENLNIGGNSTAEDRETKEVYHPSILIVINHNYSPLLIFDMSSIYDKIIYALAFWNGVDLQLRHIKNPYVRLRIAGIVFVRLNEAVPYLFRNLDSKGGVKVEKAFNAMMEYWLRVSSRNDDFRDGSFDIVATMTRYKLYEENKREKVTGVYSDKLPCLEKPKRTIAGFLLHDDLDFQGIPITVKGFANLFGAKNTEDCPARKGYVMAKNVTSMGRKWSECTLNQISSTLKRDGWCLQEAKQVHPPGKPVKTFLPGKIIPAEKQCEMRNFDGVCGEVTCTALWCVSNVNSDICVNINRTLDGTNCGDGMMCLEEKCVSDTIAII